MSDEAGDCLRDFAGAGDGNCLLGADGEKSRDGGGVGVELEESVVTLDWGFLAGRIDYTLTG